MKNFIAVAALAVALLCPGSARAVMVEAGLTDTTKTVLISTPSLTGQSVILKGCSISNTSASAACVTFSAFYAGALETQGAAKFVACVAASSTWSSGMGLANPQGGTIPPLSAMFGEQLVSRGVWYVQASAIVSTLYVDCSYDFSRMR